MGLLLVLVLSSCSLTDVGDLAVEVKLEDGAVVTPGQEIVVEANATGGGVVELGLFLDEVPLGDWKVDPEELRQGLVSQSWQLPDDLKPNEYVLQARALDSLGRAKFDSVSVSVLDEITIRLYADEGAVFFAGDTFDVSAQSESGGTVEVTVHWLPVDAPKSPDSALIVRPDPLEFSGSVLKEGTPQSVRVPPGLKPGTYRILVIANGYFKGDLLRSAQRDISVQIDTDEAPTLEISVEDYDVVKPGDLIKVFTGTSSNGGSLTVRCGERLIEQTEVAGGNTQVEVALPEDLAPGAHRLTFTLEDVNEEAYSEELVVLVAGPGPAISLDKVDGTQLISGDTITASIEDEHLDIESVQVFIDGVRTEARATGLGTRNATVTLPVSPQKVGEHQYEITVRNAAGASSTANLTYHYVAPDDAVPGARVNLGAGSVVEHGGSLEVTTWGGVTRVQVELGGVTIGDTTVGSDGGRQSHSFVIGDQVPAGRQMLVVTVYDSQGAEVPEPAVKMEILVRGEEPVINFDLTDQAILRPGESITFTVDDANYALTNVQLYLDDVRMSYEVVAGKIGTKLVDASLEIPSGVEKQSATLLVVAENEAGQRVSRSRSVSILPFPDGPGVELSTAEDGILLPGSEIEVKTRGRATVVSAWLDGKFVNSVSGDPDDWGVQSFNLAVPADTAGGYQTLRVEAEDGLGGITRREVGVRVPGDPPEASTLTGNGARLGHGDVFSIDVVDPLFEIERVTVSLGTGQLLTPRLDGMGTEHVQVDITVPFDLPLAEHLFRIEAINSVGQRAELERTISVVQSNEPRVQVVTPQTVKAGSEIRVQTQGAIVAIQATLGSVNIGTEELSRPSHADQSFTFTIPSEVDPGWQELSVEVRDTYGRIASETEFVPVLGNGPAIAFDFEEGAGFDWGERVPFVVEDDHFNLESVEVRLSGQSLASNFVPGSLSSFVDVYIPEHLPEGTYPLVVEARNDQGQSVSRQVRIAVPGADYATPVIDWLTPGVGSQVVGIVEATFTVRSHVGIQNVDVRLKDGSGDSELLTFVHDHGDGRYTARFDGIKRAAGEYILEVEATDENQMASRKQRTLQLAPAFELASPALRDPIGPGNEKANVVISVFQNGTTHVEGDLEITSAAVYVGEDRLDTIDINRDATDNELISYTWNSAASRWSAAGELIHDSSSPGERVISVWLAYKYTDVHGNELIGSVFTPSVIVDFLP